MKTTLKRLLCLVLSVLLFTMSLPVLAADVTDAADENTTTETAEVELTLEELPAEKPEGMEGSGQKNDPFIIDSAEDLRWFAEQVNNGYNKISAKLADDINLLEGLVSMERNGSTSISGPVKNSNKNSKYYHCYNQWNWQKSYSYYNETTSVVTTTCVETAYEISSSGDTVTVWAEEITTATTTTTLDVVFANDRYMNNTYTHETCSKCPETTTTTTSGPNVSYVEVATINAKTGEVEVLDAERYEDFTAHAWTPIGKHVENGENDGFNGTFDAYKYDEKGNVTGSYTIKGLYVNGVENEVGLFGHVGDATISGVKIDESYIRGNDAVGAVVGFAHHGVTIRGCWNAYASVVSGVNNVGGIVGKLDLAESGANVEDPEQQDHIYECMNRGYVYGATNVGGILGYGYHAIVKYSANMNSEVDGEDDGVNYTGYVIGNTNVGGIVGRAVSTIILGCTNYGNVKATDYVGGIVGHIDQVKSYIRKAVNYNTASVTGTNYVGGLVGYLGEFDGVEAGTTANLELFTSYNDGTVTGTTSVGGLVGYNAARGKVYNSYNSGAVLINKVSADVSATDNNGNVVGVNAGVVRDCFYYPNMYAGKTIDGKTNDNYNEKAIGNGIGTNLEGAEAVHVSGLKVAALESQAAAYLLNLVWVKAGTDDHVTEDGYHHLATHGFDGTNWDIPTYWIAGKNGPEFTTEASKSVKAIKGAQLVLNENFDVKFMVDVPSGLGDNIVSDRKVTFIRHGDGQNETLTVTEYARIEKVAGSNEYYYVFTLDHIEPHYLGDDVEVIFTAKYAIPEWNGSEWVAGTPVTVSEKTTYSVKDYCERQLGRTATELGYINEDGTENTTAYNAFRTLLCNVLNYGAAYQTYRNYKTDALVNDILAENNWTDSKDYSTMEGTIPQKAKDNYNGTKNPEFRLYSSAVKFGSENAMGFLIYGKDLSNYGEDWTLVEIKVSNGDTYKFTKTNLPNYGSNVDYFKAMAPTIKASQYDLSYTVKIYAPTVNENGEYVAATEPNETYVYTMENYVAGLLAIEDETDKRPPMAAALWNYATAVSFYVNPDKNVGGDTSEDVYLDTDNIFDADIWDKIQSESGTVNPDNPDADGDGIPDSWVRLNISAGLARLLSFFNPLLSNFFGFTIYGHTDGFYYAVPDAYWESIK